MTDEKLFYDVFVAKNIEILQKYDIWEFWFEVEDADHNITVQVGKLTGRELVSWISGGTN